MSNYIGEIKDDTSVCFIESLCVSAGIGVILEDGHITGYEKNKSTNE